MGNCGKRFSTAERKMRNRRRLSPGQSGSNGRGAVAFFLQYLVRQPTPRRIFLGELASPCHSSKGKLELARVVVDQARSLCPAYQQYQQYQQGRDGFTRGVVEASPLQNRPQTLLPRVAALLWFP